MLYFYVIFAICIVKDSFIENYTLVLCKSIKFNNNYYKLTSINFQCKVQNHESTDSNFYRFFNQEKK